MYLDVFRYMLHNVCFSETTCNETEKEEGNIDSEENLGTVKERKKISDMEGMKTVYKK